MSKVDFINLIQEENDKLNTWYKDYQKFSNLKEFKKKEDFDNKLPDLFTMGFTINLKAIKLYKEYKLHYEECRELSDNLGKLVKEQNKTLYDKRIKKFKSVAPTIEGRELDEQQLKTIVRDDNNQLVLAGAGSGKTTTIVGKVRYLLEVKHVDPEKILLLSFTNVASDDMRNRIRNETGEKLDVFTFHKLGYNIISSSSKDNPQVFVGSFYDLIKDKLLKLLENKEYLKNFIEYLEKERFALRDELSFKNIDEYNDYLMINQPCTLKNESVLNQGELEIANFLFKNGINYEMNVRYRELTTYDGKREYKSKFYLPDYDIYIGYFETDKKFRVPVYIDGKMGEDYSEYIKWVEKLHKKNNTTLVNTYYYEKKSGKLIDNLEKNLKKLGVVLKEKDIKTLWEEIKDTQNEFLLIIMKSIETVISLIKSNDYTIEEVRKMCSLEFKTDKIALLDIIEPLYDYYNEYLVKNNKVDFNDMINRASKLVAKGKFKHKYDYVLVDEYQDISRARYRLLKALRDRHNYKLFCVGDDWQSIYQFSGSDVSFIINFKDYWGDTHISKIEHTYRLSEKMAEISGNFIMKNKRQVKKNMIGLENGRFPLGLLSAGSRGHLLNILALKLDDLPRDSTVLFLGRYDRDFEFIYNDTKHFNVKYDYNYNIHRITYYNRPRLRIIALTIHKSKGLEADYVFVLNNKNTLIGFPSKIFDLPLVNLLMEKGDSYAFAEERRLMYVALTRSKNKTYLLAMNKQKSVFVNELESEYKSELEKEYFECPWCDGRLIKKRTVEGDILGCTKYKKDGTGCNYSRRIHKY